MKKIFLGLILFFATFLFVSPSVQAKEAFDIIGYQVDIKVTKQNKYFITENIQCNFLENRHGIFRTIPIENQVKRTDGTSSVTRAKISNIQCSDNMSTSVDNGSYVIKIGDEDKTFSGNKDYLISYEYDLGKDQCVGADEFYFNVIGQYWDTTIENVTFSIEMTDDIDESKLGMVYGKNGEQKTKNLNYYIDGNVIHGILENVKLKENEGVTVRYELPEGYFEYVEPVHWMPYFAIGCAVLALMLAFVFWLIFGRDKKVVPVVNFHSPDGLNSLEAAYSYKGSVEDKDVVSLIVYLAQKGYLTIKEEEKNGFILCKRKNYDGDKECERVFLEGLFSRCDVVTNKELRLSFSTTNTKLKSMYNSKQAKKKLFYANSLNKTPWIWALSLLAYVFAAYKPLDEYYFSGLVALIAPLFAGILINVAVASVFGPGKKKRFFGLLVSFLTFMFFAALIYYVLIDDALKFMTPIYEISFFVCVVLSMVSMFFCCFMSKRTPYGTRILGELEGFKEFLKTAELDKLRELVNEEPEYFYNILPFTYVFDLDTTWVKKFEDITVEKPDWYTGNNSTFSVSSFSSFMSSTVSTASSSVSTSSGGGGGSSGGGSGGGGGGSW